MKETGFVNEPAYKPVAENWWNCIYIWANMLKVDQNWFCDWANMLKIDKKLVLKMNQLAENLWNLFCGWAYLLKINWYFFMIELTFYA